jgi:quinoprotein glucose dehydrogenase
VDAVKGNDATQKGMGLSVYGKYCLSCHGPDLKGNGTAYPSLQQLEKKYTEEAVTRIIANGKNMMPAFKQLTDVEKQSLLSFIMNKPDKEPGQVGNSTNRTKNILDEVPYTMTGYNRFVDSEGYPGITPPWATLNAINLNTGKLIWKVPLGEYPELTKQGVPITGTEGYGGPLVTKGGLVFIAATKDAKMHAFDKQTGKLLWQASLPVPGYATPATYQAAGKQYVVIACGGGKIGSKSGDQYVAFALPD